MTPLDRLSTTQREALDSATAFVQSRYSPWGIVAAGTIVRGESDANSDVDLYVLHDAPFRQRVQRFFAGVPFEIFVNTEVSVARYLEDEEAEGRPLTAHMLATGVVLVGARDARMERLLERARKSLASEPRYTQLDLTRGRYGAACHFEDAIDRQHSDPETAMRLLGRGVDAAVSYWFKKQRVFIPRQKEVLAKVAERDAELDRLVRRFWGDHPYSQRWTAGIEIADRVLGTRGFFEWESEREPVASSA